jgi:hypothetical protein
MNLEPTLQANGTDPGEPPISAPRSRWDRLGFFASSLCAVHCVCMPWLLLALPLLAGTWLVDREIERGFVVASILLATACTVGGCRTHGKWWLLGLLGAGATTLIGAHVTAPPTCCSEHLSWPNALGAAFGGTLLAATHFFNLRLQRGWAPPSGNRCVGTECGCD